METSLKTGFAQIFSCCPKNLSRPKFGGGGCSPPRSPGPYAYVQMLFTCLFNCSLLPIDSPSRSLANTGTTYQGSWILAQCTEISLSSFVRKQISMIMHVSCRYELYETYTFSFIPWRTLLGHYTSYCILAAVAPIHFFSMQ